MFLFKIIFTGFTLMTFCSCLNAQQFGGNPPSIKWNQVNTPEARIIFPQQLDSSATRISNIISYLNRSTQNTIGTKQRKINLVLQNQTTISNAYVSLGPFRSEFFLTPLQSSFELVSLQGRGRLPFFYKDYRSLWQADKKYSWMKLRNGSYKDFVPDHYALGYLLVAYGREKYGDDFWKNVTHDAAAFKGLFYPFQKAIKKYSGKSYVEFRNDALNYFKNRFDLKDETQKINSSHKEFINEEFPSFTDDNTIVYVRSTYKHIPTF